MTFSFSFDWHFRTSMSFSQRPFNCWPFLPFSLHRFESYLTRDCVFATLQSIREWGGGAWWHTMTMFSPAAQRAPNKLVTVISSSINERAGCDTLKSTHGRWRQRQGWLIKQYVHARKRHLLTRTHAARRTLEIWPDIFPLSRSVPTQSEEGQNNPVRDYEYEMLFIESCSVD